MNWLFRSKNEDEYLVEDSESLANETHFAQREMCMTKLMQLVQEDFENVVKSRPVAKKKLFVVMVAWLVFIAFVLVFNNTCGLALSDSVLIALVSGGAAQVIGLYLVVATHLFPRNGATITPAVIDSINKIARTPDEDPSSFTVNADCASVPLTEEDEAQD